MVNPFSNQAVLVGPIGWLFGAVAILFITLFARLWYSIGNKERRAMENELREARIMLEQYTNHLSTINSQYEATKITNKSLQHRNQTLEQAKALLEDTVNKQGMLISGLSERCIRNEKLILKLYADLGLDIDLRYIGGGGDQPQS